ncbi:MAG: hypothetical protein NVSMB39_5710 [Candidatus Saccharimonadales bacterium]
MLQLRKKPVSHPVLNQGDYDEIIDKALEHVRSKLELRAGASDQEGIKILDLVRNLAEPNYHLDAQFIEHDGSATVQLQLRQLGVPEDGHWPTWTISECPHQKASLLYVSYKQWNHFRHQLTIDDEVRPSKVPAHLGNGSFLRHLTESARSFAHLYTDRRP